MGISYLEIKFRQTFTFSLVSKKKDNFGKVFICFSWVVSLGEVKTHSHKKGRNFSWPKRRTISVQQFAKSNRTNTQTDRQIHRYPVTLILRIKTL